MTYLTIDEINSNTIYQPPAHWINQLPTELLNDITTRNYRNCVCGRSKRLIQHTPKQHSLEYLEKSSWGRIYTEQEKQNHDNFGFFLGESVLKVLYRKIGFYGSINNDYNPDRCGVEVVGRTLQCLNVVGNEHYQRKLLTSCNDMENDGQDHSYCKDIAWVKKCLTMNKVNGRSKATTMEKAVKLLMSF